MTVIDAWATARHTKVEREPRISIVLRLVTFLAKQMPRWVEIRSAVLQVTGIGLIDYAAFQWHTIAGWLALGVSLLVIEALIE